MYAKVWRIKRRILNLRQRDIADRTRMSQARFSLLERGEALPTPQESEAIGKALELPDGLLDELLRAFSMPDETTR
jgi:transcriptional regulator with XRE-family HTH domain